MKAKQLWFVAPQALEIREHELESPGQGEVLVRSLYSGISAGTELLAYRGLLPADMQLDANISAMKGKGTEYPFPYGYACVGEIIETGPGVNADLIGRKIFAFQPHASMFTARQDELIFLPEQMSDLDAVFVANMETACSLLIDADPAPGESIAVLGLGVVGQLVSRLLFELDYEKLYLIDSIDQRTEFALSGQLNEAIRNTGINPNSSGWQNKLSQPGVDLIIELSGNPEALNTAIDIAAFAGRIIVGSWYGEKTANIKLGGKFHRNRLKVISSQVSTISPEHEKTWTKKTRMEKALESIIRLKPHSLVTHQFSLEAANEAYDLLDKHPETAMQIVFNYED